MASHPGSDQGKGGKSGQAGVQKTSAKRGFAAMSEAQQREIASKGGQAAHQKGTAHEFDTEEARRAGQKGGEVVSRDREHMAEIGRKGARAASRRSAKTARTQPAPAAAPAPVPSSSPGAARARATPSRRTKAKPTQGWRDAGVPPAPATANQGRCRHSDTD